MAPIALALVLSTALLLAPRRLRPWVAVGITVSLVILPLTHESVRTTSHHGFFHASIVEQLEVSGVPPENPLLAGEPLHYPYGTHLVLAWVGAWTGLSPDQLFAALQVLSLLIAFAAMGVVARRFSSVPSSSRGDSGAEVAGGTSPGSISATGADWPVIATLALLSTYVVAAGPLLEFAQNLGLPLETRAYPLRKFLNVTTNQTGVAAFGVVMAAVARILTDRGAGIVNATGLTLGLLASGFFYPPSLPASVTAVGLGVLFHPQSLSTGKSARLYLLVPLGLALLGLAPWLSSFGDTGGSMLQFGLSSRKVTTVLVALLIPMGAFALAFTLRVRKDLPPLTTNSRLGSSWLLSLAAVLYIAFLVVQLPTGNEYKFALFALQPISLATFGFLVPLLPRSPERGISLVALTLLPFVSISLSLADNDWRLEYPVTSSGGRLVAVDASEDAIYSWIRQHTEASAVFVDTELVLPPLAGRSLFVALPKRATTREGRKKNGWGPVRWVLLEMLGSDVETVGRRAALADRLLRSRGKVDPRLLQLLRGEMEGRPIYVLARDRVQRETMEATPGLEQVFEAGRIRIFVVNESIP